ncbi:uncharacterized protein ACBR49_000604 [Aulostomus maculatus]
MAARWRGKDGSLNASNGDFLCSNNPSQFSLCRGGDVNGVDMDPQSCMDHSILAIFEDSTVSPEDKSGGEGESETLLSALTEMLDCVEDDVGTLSPFDTLPDTKLLTYQEYRDMSSDEVTLAGKLKLKCDGDKEEKRLQQVLKQQSHTLFHTKNKKAESENVEVFTSSSLVNLVRIMHPYCLKLHVEGEERGPAASSWNKVKGSDTLFSREEIWKYERPTGDSDEEINVVSDEETPLKQAKEEEDGETKRSDEKLLKSVLLNGNSPRTPSSREKKRVRFGPVQVASLDETMKTEQNEKNVVAAPPNNTEAPASPTLKALTAPLSSRDSPEANGLQPKGQAKTKSLSLQQYRQLRQRRQPLVEKQGNYTTLWPSVTEPPKELTPILCSHGQRPSSCGPKTAHHQVDCIGNSTCQHPRNKQFSRRAPLSPRLPPGEDKPTFPTQRRGYKCPRTETASPASPLPDVTVDTAVNICESRESPVKKLTLLSSDPPNPVLLPLPSTVQSKGDSNNQDSSMPEIQMQSQTSSSDPKPKQDYGPKCTRTQETKPSGISSGSPVITQSEFNSDHKITHEIKMVSKGPQLTGPDPAMCLSLPPYTNQPTTCLHTPPPGKGTLPEGPSTIPLPDDQSPQLSCKETGPDKTFNVCCYPSGIEAPDVTSLLEQFEEKQAKEEGESKLETAHNFTRSAPPLHLQPHTDQERSQEPEWSTPESRKATGNQPDVHIFEHLDILEPVGTEIILSTREEHLLRRKNPPPKAIQIIDPRPLPAKKASVPEFSHCSPRVYSFVSFDHDYCGPLDHSPPSGTQRSGAKPLMLKDTDKTADEVQVTTSRSSASYECKKQASNAEFTTTVHGKYEVQDSEDHRTRSFSDGGVSEDGTAPCTLPTPPPTPPSRGRKKRRYRRSSPNSDSSSSSWSSSSSSSSSSPSRSPKRPRLHHKRSESSSSSSCSVSSSPPRHYRLSRSRFKRSRSRSWSGSRSPSPSLRTCRRRWRDVYSSRESRKLQREHEARIQKLKAIDERRVVYVGRIRRSMTHDELRERFSQFGEVECVSLHFRDKGDHYGFVTFYNMEDAFAAIDNGGKLRRPDELPFDICFGGRRQFCNSDYADLDANKVAERSLVRSRFEELDFDSLLKQAQRGLKR